MSTYNSRLGICDIIFSVNSEGYCHPWSIGQVLFTSNEIEYRNHIGTHICYDRELDNINSESDMYYFTSKVKRNEFIKTRSL